MVKKKEIGSLEIDVSEEVSKMVNWLSEELKCSKDEVIEKAIKLLNHCFVQQKNGAKLISSNPNTRAVEDIIIAPKGYEQD